MVTPKKGPRLGGSPAHQRLILSNLATQLIENGSVRTTEAKARLLQPMFEKLVTRAKRGDIHSRRLVARKIRSRDAVYALFDEVVPSIDPERQGGYTRIIRLGNRKGDNAPMVLIEIVTERVEKKAVVREAEATAKSAAKADEAATETAEDAKATEDTAAEAADEATESTDAEEASEAAEAGDADVDSAGDAEAATDEAAADEADAAGETK